MAMTGLILPYRGIFPRIADSAFIAPNAAVIGDVEIGPDSGIWFGCILRGDVYDIKVGARTNLQDGTIVHVSKGHRGTWIGSDVTVGHGAIIHACTLEDGAFVGMRATILDDATVEGGAMVAAGALVGPGKRATRGYLWAGVPAKPVRELSDDEKAMMDKTAPHYAELAREYATELRRWKT
jgi:carbonic anhydrase/acetyltransferase-like protein (isoleucine patch superfamily)